ncbi:hypothetical protein PR048_031658 [Dryococelus australis]|uniref:Uncharacterized protein n=1 Tax=Dryococelus australis TaxID=614101 RepID=A0ABQ9G8U6_9NEOP|nr:hypothetical protein PR048_031658 [Dryococelus australis]
MAECVSMSAQSTACIASLELDTETNRRDVYNHTINTALSGSFGHSLKKSVENYPTNGLAVQRSKKFSMGSSFVLNAAKLLCSILDVPDVDDDFCSLSSSRTKLKEMNSVEIEVATLKDSERIGSVVNFREGLGSNPGPGILISAFHGVSTSHSRRMLGCTFTTVYGWYKLFTVSMEQRRNARAGETEDPRANTPTSGIVRHDSHLRKSGSDPAGDWTRFALVGDNLYVGRTVAVSIAERITVSVVEGAVGLQLLSVLFIFHVDASVQERGFCEGDVLEVAGRRAGCVRQLLSQQGDSEQLGHESNTQSAPSYYFKGNGARKPLETTIAQRLLPGCTNIVPDPRSSDPSSEPGYSLILVPIAAGYFHLLDWAARNYASRVLKGPVYLEYLSTRLPSPEVCVPLVDQHIGRTFDSFAEKRVFETHAVTQFEHQGHMRKSESDPPRREAIALATADNWKMREFRRRIFKQESIFQRDVLAAEVNLKRSSEEVLQLKAVHNKDLDPRKPRTEPLEMKQVTICISIYDAMSSGNFGTCSLVPIGARSQIPTCSSNYSETAVSSVSEFLGGFLSPGADLRASVIIPAAVGTGAPGRFGELTVGCEIVLGAFPTDGSSTAIRCDVAITLAAPATLRGHLQVSLHVNNSVNDMVDCEHLGCLGGIRRAIEQWSINHRIPKDSASWVVDASALQVALQFVWMVVARELVGDHLQLRGRRPGSVREWLGALVFEDGNTCAMGREGVGVELDAVVAGR